MWYVSLPSFASELAGFLNWNSRESDIDIVWEFREKNPYRMYFSYSKNNDKVLV